MSRASDRRVQNKLRKGITVYKVKVAQEVLDANGYVMQFPDPDPKIRDEARKTALAEGKERYDMPLIDADFKGLFCYFLNGIPWERDDKDVPIRKLDTEEAGNIYKIIKAFRSPDNGYVVLDDGQFKKLNALITSDGVAALGINYQLLVDLVADSVEFSPNGQSKDG